MAACLIFNSLEFEGIKISVVNAVPHTKEQDGVLVFEPLFDGGSSSIEVPHHVGEGDVVAARLSQDSDGYSLDFDRGSFRFADIVERECARRIAMVAWI